MYWCLCCAGESTEEADCPGGRAFSKANWGIFCEWERITKAILNLHELNKVYNLVVSGYGIEDQRGGAVEQSRSCRGLIGWNQARAWGCQVGSSSPEDFGYIVVILNACLRAQVAALNNENNENKKLIEEGEWLFTSKMIIVSNCWLSCEGVAREEAQAGKLRWEESERRRLHNIIQVRRKTQYKKRWGEKHKIKKGEEKSTK